MNTRWLFRMSALLWLMWGVLHLLGGVSMVSTFMAQVAGVPETITLNAAGGEMPFHVRRVIAEHQFNNMWFGLVVTVSSVLVWRRSRLAVILCVVVGGLAHLGFTLFLVLPGFANTGGVVMTFVAAGGAILGVAAEVLQARPAQQPVPA